MADATTSASLLKATKLTENEDLSIPLVDITPLLSPSSTLESRQTVGKAILSAFETSGFLYLSALPVPTSQLTSVFSNSAAFFARPQEQKDGLAWYSAEANRGYSTFGREKVSTGMSTDEVAADRSNPDLKESMEIGRDGEEGCPNMWPDKIDAEGAKFREVMTGFFDSCKAVHAVIMRAIALGLGLDETFFADYVRTGDNTLRLLHYPPVAAEVFKNNAGAVRAGAHTDYGSITLLFQDDRGGLQVETDPGQWRDVKPIEGTVVVNAGDLLARWSNGRIRSTMHRVMNPPLRPGEEQLALYPARYSIAYFCNPDFDRLIDALPGTWEREGKKWEAVNSGVYLRDRLTATY